MKQYSVGQVVEQSGKYGILDKNGVPYIGLEIELKTGDAFPPTVQDDQTYYRCEEV